MMIVSKTVFDFFKPMPPFIRSLRDANREGRKTQTRRVMDPQPPHHEWSRYKTDGLNVETSGQFIHCRYGSTGDLRYMREPIYHGFGGVAYYQDDDVMIRSLLTGEPITWRWQKDVLSQLYMPKEAARTFKKYEFIRVERLQDISRADAKAEGVSNLWQWTPDRNPDHFRRGVLNPYVANYSVLWDEINAERGYGWDLNPWVWVIGYGDFFKAMHDEDWKKAGL